MYTHKHLSGKARGNNKVGQKVSSQCIFWSHTHTHTHTHKHKHLPDVQARGNNKGVQRVAAKGSRIGQAKGG